MSKRTFTRVVLTSLGGLDDLGLLAVDQRLAGGVALVEREVADPVPWCPRCGCRGKSLGSVARRLAHVPFRLLGEAHQDETACGGRPGLPIALPPLFADDQTAFFPVSRHCPVVDVRAPARSTACPRSGAHNPSDGCPLLRAHGRRGQHEGALLRDSSYAVTCGSTCEVASWLIVRPSAAGEPAHGAPDGQRCIRVGHGNGLLDQDTDFGTPHPARGRHPTTTTSHPTTTSPGPTNDDLWVSRQDNEARGCPPPMGAVSWSCLRACSQV